MTKPRTATATAKACRVCEHPERCVIDRAMIEFGQAPCNVKRRYAGVSRRAIQRHRDVCLKARPASLKDAAA